MRTVLFSICLTALLLRPARAQFRTTKDIEFAKVDDRSLRLDLYFPPEATALKTPLLVYIHGGAWRAGDKRDMPLKRLVESGYAVASVDYRLSPDAPFPAQVYDIKAALRFLRDRGADLGVDAARIVVVGSSAGGHLAALVGVSNGVKSLEGAVGTHLNARSDVQGIISLFGASNLETILSQSTPHGLEVRIPALQLLLGGQPAEKLELARLASPVFHVDPTDPPLLLIHGDADPQMPFEQSVELQRAYQAAKLPVRFEVVHGGQHGGPDFYDESRTAVMLSFLGELK